MILACEEMGKAKYARLLAIGALKEKRGGKNALSSMDVLLSRHPQKQMLAHDVELPYLSELIAEALSGLSLPTEVDVGTPAGRQALHELKREIEARIEGMVDPARLKDDVEKLQLTWDEVVTGARLDKLKQRGLYVDFSEDRAGVLTPQDIGPTEFREVESLFERSSRSSDVIAVNGLTAEVIQTLRGIAAKDQ